MTGTRIRMQMSSKNHYCVCKHFWVVLWVIGRWTNTSFYNNDIVGPSKISLPAIANALRLENSLQLFIKVTRWYSKVLLWEWSLNKNWHIRQNIYKYVEFNCTILELSLFQKLVSENLFLTLHKNEMGVQSLQASSSSCSPRRVLVLQHKGSHICIALHNA